MININAIRDAYLLPYFPFGFMVIPDQNLILSQCTSILSPRNTYTDCCVPAERVLKDQHEEFHSKTFQSIVLSSEDLSENKETFSLQGQTYYKHIDNLKNSQIIQEKRNRKQIEKKTKKLIHKYGKLKESRQKQSRNIYSNLLRIFMRNLLEVGMYTSLMERIISKQRFSFSAEDFYRWLYTFHINYKNYIRIKQLSNIFSSRHTVDYQTTFLLILRSFLNHYAIGHCLTSRKIGGNGRMMHLQGVRSLRRAVHDLASRRC